MNSETKDIVMNLTPLNNFLSQRILAVRECCEYILSTILDEDIHLEEYYPEESVK